MFCCPLLQNRYPHEACPYALNTIKNLRSHNDVIKFKLLETTITTEEECDWYVLDEESCYCFWKFWSIPSNVKEYKLEDVAKLLGLCTEAVFFAEKKGMFKVSQYANYLYDNESMQEFSLDKLVGYNKQEVWSLNVLVEQYNILHVIPIPAVYQEDHIEIKPFQPVQLEFDL